MSLSRFVVAATGHRPSKLSGGWDAYGKWGEPVKAYEVVILGELQKLLEERGNLHLISGLALGWDSIFLRAGLRFQERLGVEAITLEGAAPCTHQDSRWSPKDKRRYSYFLEKLSRGGNRFTYVSPHDFSWEHGNQMQARNEYMVDKCDLLIACFDGSPGGTKRAIDYALKKRDCEIRCVDPYSLEVTTIRPKLQTLF